MTEPRRIITLAFLKETFSALVVHTPDIFKKIVEIYSLPFDEAFSAFEFYKQNSPTKEVEEIWQHFQNALKNMSPKERENFRKECEQEAKSQ